MKWNGLTLLVADDAARDIATTRYHWTRGVTGFQPVAGRSIDFTGFQPADAGFHGFTSFLLADEGFSLLHRCPTDHSHGGGGLPLHFTSSGRTFAVISRMLTDDYRQTTG